jgi:hypothetical protein
MTTANPSLVLNFARAKRLDSRFTFTRNSTATYVGPDGIIRSAAAGEPRFTHDPDTLAPEGLLLENAATNYLRYGQDFENAYWGKLALLTTTNNAAVAPDGTTTAGLIVPDTTSGTHYIQKLVTTMPYVNGDKIVLSAFVKAAGYNVATLSFHNAIAQCRADFNLDTGTIHTFTTEAAYIQEFPNGWFRITIMDTVDSAGAYPANIVLRLRVYPSTPVANYSGDGTSGMYIWGLQGEKNYYPSSVLLTSGNADTSREADVLTMPDISDWYNPSRGTFIGEVKSLYDYPTGGNNLHWLSVGDVSGSVLYRVDNVWTYRSWDGNSDVGTLGTLMINYCFKYGMTYGDGVRDFTVDWKTSDTGTLAGPTFGNMAEGLKFTLNSAQGQVIKSLTYIPDRVSRSELNRLTGLTRDDVNTKTDDEYAPTLTLNFAGLNQLDPRIDTFTRNSIATMFDSHGLVKSVGVNEPRFGYDPATKEPLGVLIEQGFTQFAKYSERMQGTESVESSDWTWGTSGGNTSNLVRARGNVTEAPDGSMNGTKILSGNDGSAKYHSWGQTVTVSERTVPHVVSFFVKADEYTQCVVKIVSGSMSAGGGWAVSVLYDLSTGVVVSTSGTYYTDSGIQNVGNGWWRVRVNASQVGGTAGPGVCAITIAPAAGNADFITGDGKSGIYVWGGNLKQGSPQTSYIPSIETFTSRASTATYYGSDGLLKTAAIDEARMNYNPARLTAAPKLLTEPSAKNILTYSEDINSWPSKNQITVESNYTDIKAPDGNNTATALWETSVSAFHSINNTFPVDVSGSFVFSLFVHSSSNRSVILRASGTTFPSSPSVVFKHTTKTTQTNDTTTTSGSMYVGNGWFRVWWIVNSSSTGTGTFTIYLTNDTDPSPESYVGLGSQGAKIWGAQIEEQKIQASSYIPTTTAAVTRSADVSSSAGYTTATDVMKITGTNFSEFYNKYEGTFIVEGVFSDKITTGSDFPMILSATNGSDLTQQVTINARSTDQKFGYSVTTDNVAQVSSIISNQAVLPNTEYGVAVSYKLNDFKIAAEGVQGSTDTAGTPPSSVSVLNIGTRNGSNPINGYISKLVYVPKSMEMDLLKGVTRC